MNYSLVMSKSRLKIAIKIVDLPIENGDFPNVHLPGGIPENSCAMFVFLLRRFLC